MSKITEQLYLGSSVEAMDIKWLKDHYVTHVVNCTLEHPNYFPDDFNYLKLNLMDSPDQTLYHVFERVHNYIKSAIGNGGTVFVHCHAGISRSSSMVIYFVMKVKKWPFEEALKYVKNRRPVVNPNSGFIKQLISVSPEAKITIEPKTIRVQKYDHPYDIRGREGGYIFTPQKYSYPHAIESRGELLRKFLSNENF